MTNSFQFAWDFPGLSIERSASRDSLNPRQTRIIGHSTLCTYEELRLGGFKKFAQDYRSRKQPNRFQDPGVQLHEACELPCSRGQAFHSTSKKISHEYKKLS